MARSRWRVKSNIWPREIYDQTSVHFGLKSPLSASRNSFAGSHVVVLLEKDLGNPEMRQRWTAQRCTAVRFKRLLIFLYGFAVFADLGEPGLWSKMVFPKPEVIRDKTNADAELPNVSNCAFATTRTTS